MTTSMKYNGNVNISLFINNKTINISRHNNGLPALSLAFCKMLAGETLTIEDIPKYIDLKVSSDASFSTYTSNLIHLATATGASYGYVGDNYVFNITSVISYDTLISPITTSDNNYYRLYLLSGSLSAESGYKELAYIDIEANKLANISPGTQMIINWSMQLTN